jgi:RNA polymerase sporulation-specific sigma factor
MQSWIFHKNRESKNKIIEHNLRLVWYIANRYKSQGTDIEDLTSVGTIGLIKAIDTFDPSKNIRLTTYSVRCIENEILMFLKKQKRQQNNLSYQDTFHFDDEEGKELSIIDMIGSDKEEIVNQITQKEEVQHLKKTLLRLSHKEQEIIKLRYGIDCVKMKQEHISERFQVTQSCISRIEKRVLKKLKKEMVK